MEEKNISLSEEKKNSITLKKDAKGNHNWDIKIYFNDDKDNAINTIKGIDSELKNIYG